jgi:hypothetical protein
MQVDSFLLFPKRSTIMDTYTLDTLTETDASSFSSRSAQSMTGTYTFERDDDRTSSRTSISVMSDSSRAMSTTSAESSTRSLSSFGEMLGLLSSSSSTLP